MFWNLETIGNKIKDAYLCKKQQPKKNIKKMLV